MTWPIGGGEMGERIRVFDWSATPLGPIETWPQSLRTAVDLMLGARQPVFIGWGPQLHALYNDGYIPILGVKHPHALSKPFKEVWAEIWEDYASMVQATLAGQAHYQFNQPVALAGRAGLPVSYFTFAWTPLRDEFGQIVGIYSAATETTQNVREEQSRRRREAEALRKSELRYRRLFDSIDEGLCVLEVLCDERLQPIDCRYLEVNPAFERQTGMRDAVGKTLSELVPNVESRWHEIFGQIALSRQPRRFSDYVPSMNRWFDVYAFPFGEPQERQVAVLFRDVTQQRKSEERLRGALKIKTVGVMFWSRDFKLLDVNEAFLQMSGFSREDALGKTWQELTPVEYHPISLKAVKQVITTGESTPFEKQYLRKDGSRWWGLFAARRLGDEVVEFVLDVTERRQVEEALRATDRRKDEFLATLAHELRNPLAPLRNGLQIARLTGPADLRFQRTLDMMDRQLSHLVRLVDDLLDVGRISSGKLELRREPVNLAAALSTSIEATRTLIDNQHHELIYAPGEGEVTVLGDFDRLAQVFTNLLSNAARYTEPGGRISIEMDVQDDHAVVRITDTGIGIPHSETANVFDLFSQVRSHQGKFGGGLGIGLSLVKNIVALHGGTVNAHSSGPNQGSTFTVSLPLLKVAEHHLYAASSDQTPHDEHARRILVADDNRDTARSLAILLELMGHQVWTADDGQDALEKATKLEPDVIFLDLGMPRMDGFEAARRIRTLPVGHDTTIVALTGWGQESDRRRTLEAGFDKHLVKPVNTSQLREILAGTAAHRRPETARKH